MHPDLIDENFARYRNDLADLLDRLHALAEAAGSHLLLPVIGQLRVTIAEPFLFVVVGEIKAGKSSFINALLGAEVCRVDPAPCTDTIQEIVWSAERQEDGIGPHLQRIGLPAEILKDIAIVDTPGTNTIIEHHQEITQRYIPNSGLVIFVFPAKNPHTRSAWQLLETVSDEWRKRVVFVLQQADLATANELAVNTAKVIEYARARSIADPRIFATSAVRELAGQPSSGFSDVRRYIRETVTGGRHFYLKLRAILDTSEALFEKIGAALAAARRQLDADIGRSDALAARAKDREARSLALADALVREVLARFDACADRLVDEFARGLGVAPFFRRSVGAVFGRKAGLDAWLQGLDKDFQTHLDRETAEVLGRSGRQILEDIEEFLKALAQSLAEMSAAVPRPEDPVIDFWQRRDAIMAELQRNITALQPEMGFSENLTRGPERAGSTLVGGGAMALMGALLLATTHITLLDVTGGILTGAGLLLTGGVLVTRRSRMRRELEDGLKAAKQQLTEALQTRLKNEIAAIYTQINQRLDPLAVYLSQRRTDLEAVDLRGRHLGEAFARLSAEVDRVAATLNGRP